MHALLQLRVLPQQILREPSRPTADVGEGERVAAWGGWRRQLKDVVHVHELHGRAVEKAVAPNSFVGIASIARPAKRSVVQSSEAVAHS